MLTRFVAATLAGIAAFQSQQPPIRSGVDLIRLDVSVVDKSGKPITDLRPEDFVVRVDGAPRTVSFATFYGSEADASRAPAPAGPAGFATNATGARGRAVIFAVDLESISPGSGKIVFDTAAKLIDGLNSADAVGLMPLPGKGIDLTRDRARVKAGLEALRGFAPHSPARHPLSMGEAEAFLRGDKIVVADVLERSCRLGDTVCPREVAKEAKDIIVEAQRRILTIMPALVALYDRLRYLDAPKSVVLMSAGLPYSEEYRSRFRELERLSAESGVTTHVVHIEQPDFDASSRRGAGAETLPRSDLALGLTNIAGVTNGEYYSGIGTAAGVFERVRMEITNSYQLGIESTKADVDGRSHKIDVEIKRPGTTVKSRRRFAVASSPRPALSPVDALSLPGGMSDLPIAAAAYTTRGDEAESLKVVVLVQLQGGPVETLPPSYAISIVGSQDERVVFETADRTTISPESGARAVVGVQLAPGQYRLRTSIAAPGGRAGSLEMPIAVGLRQIGNMQASDLLVGRVVERFSPATHLTAGTPAVGFLELYAADPAELADVAITLELRKGNESAVLAQGKATVAETALPRRRIAQGELPTSGLAPGEYTVSALIQKGSQPVGKVSRVIAITTP